MDWAHVRCSRFRVRNILLSCGEVTVETYQGRPRVIFSLLPATPRLLWKKKLANIFTNSCMPSLHVSNPHRFHSVQQAGEIAGPATSLESEVSLLSFFVPLARPISLPRKSKSNWIRISPAARSAERTSKPEQKKSHRKTHPLLDDILAMYSR
jgi:hypothetical protein